MKLFGDVNVHQEVVEGNVNLPVVGAVCARLDEELSHVPQRPHLLIVCRGSREDIAVRVTDVEAQTFVSYPNAGAAFFGRQGIGPVPVLAVRTPGISPAVHRLSGRRPPRLGDTLSNQSILSFIIFHLPLEYLL